MIMEYVEPLELRVLFAQWTPPTIDPIAEDQLLRQFVAFHEVSPGNRTLGYDRLAYQDSVGIWTIGIGSNVDGSAGQQKLNSSP